MFSDMIVGIRREDKNEWERRVPLTPTQVRELISQGFQVYVQPSPIRIFKDEEYRQAGAVVQEDLSSCSAVFAVKEIPATFFREGGTYMFFSNTLKGQPYNMPMLRKILDEKATLNDYEKVSDEMNRRLIFFGNYAGTAGMLETLYTLGKRLAWEGFSTPFGDLKRPLEYPGLAEAKAAVQAAGERIAREGLPESISPLVVGFTGYGNVSKGAQEIFKLLPHEAIPASDLVRWLKEGKVSNRKLYKVVFYEKDMVERRDAGSDFNLTE